MGKLRSKWRWNIARDLRLTAHNNCVFSLLEFCNNTSKLAGPGGISGTPAAQLQLQSVKQRWAHRYNIRWNENNDQELCLQFTLQIHSRHIAIKFQQNVDTWLLAICANGTVSFLPALKTIPGSAPLVFTHTELKVISLRENVGSSECFLRQRNISVSFFQNNRLGHTHSTLVWK